MKFRTRYTFKTKNGIIMAGTCLSCPGDNITFCDVDTNSYPRLSVLDPEREVFNIPARYIKFESFETVDEIEQMDRFVEKILSEKMLFIEPSCFDPNVKEREHFFYNKGESLGQYFSTPKIRLMRTVFWDLILEAAKNSEGDVFFARLHPYSEGPALYKSENNGLRLVSTFKNIEELYSFTFKKEGTDR